MYILNKYFRKKSKYVMKISLDPPYLPDRNFKKQQLNLRYSYNSRKNNGIIYTWIDVSVQNLLVV